jgi:hypothetical protein
MKGIGRIGGYLAFIVLVTAWWTHTFGPAGLIVLSLIVTALFRCQAPISCAVNRDGTLRRNNSSGLLLGCSNRQHKWHKLKMTVVPHAWRHMNGGLWANRREGLTTLGPVAGLVSTAAGTVALASEEVLAEGYLPGEYSDVAQQPP